MKNFFTKAFAFLLCAVMLATSAPLDGFVFEADAAGYQVGKIIKFGSYPQSRNTDGTFKVEPIEWRILSVDTDGIFVVSEKILDTYKFHNCEPFPTWAKSKIRTWLNSDFYNKAFSVSEKAKIATSHIRTEDYGGYDGGTDTCDKIFLLSCSDILNTDYGFENITTWSDTRIAKATDYARYNSVNVDFNNWWLRSPSKYDKEHASAISYVGYVSTVLVDYPVGVRPAMVIKHGTEVFDAIARKGISADYDISFPVYTLSIGGSQTAANGAEVSIYIGAERIANTSVKNGVAGFKKSDFSSKYDIEYIKKNGTVSAKLNPAKVLELTSDIVNENGVWQKTKLSKVINNEVSLVIDEPRYYLPPLNVLINQWDVEDCKNILKEYSQFFAQSTNGHVIANKFNLKIVPESYTTYSKDTVAREARNNNIDICMVRNKSTGAWANPIDNHNYSSPGWIGSVESGYGYSSKIIWCPVNNNSCAKTLCHESGHYFFGFLDEYASAIGKYTAVKNNPQNPNKYNTYYAYDFDENGVLGPHEQYGAYWSNHYGYVIRPSYAPKNNFGLMEDEKSSIELSRASSYSGINTEDYEQYTLQYFALQASCEEKLAYELNELAKSYGYGTKYDFATQTQTASYTDIAGGKNVSFESDYSSLSGVVSVISNSADEGSVVPLNEQQWSEKLCDFDFLNSDINITSAYSVNVEIKDLSGNIIQNVLLNEENGYSYALNFGNEKIYLITVTAEIDGASYSNDYILSTETAKTGLEFAEDNSTLTLYSDVESEYATVYACNSGENSNGEYASLLGEYMVFTENDANVDGGFSTTVEFNLPIDYSSMTWFYKYDGEWTALETSIGTAEHGEPVAGCNYVGDGTYCLMAKNVSDTVYSTPTELTVTNTDAIYDNDVTVTFADSNENVLHYNIYYGTESITAENCEDMNVYVADSTQATVSLKDSETTYYFAVQAVGNDGGKSELSESVSCIGALIDSDSDGLPDNWIAMYPMLAELDDIPGTDSDEDGLENIEEYEFGTDPLNPDTDGDNVYDGIEFENSLNPLEPMSDGETDDYYIVYGTPDPEINASSFAIVDDVVTCSIENNADGKAMRTNISIYDASGELLELNEVNLISNGFVTFEFSKEYLVNGMKIVVDEEQITRDSDYSNNEFVYSPATSISTTDSELTLVKNSSEQLEFVCTPADATDIFSWKSDNESVITVDNNGHIECNSIGETTVTVTTSLGYTCSFDILVEPFKGAGLTEFDCKLINNNSKVEITGYVGDETSIVIPRTIGNINVVSISADAFINQWDMTAISIHSGITSIGEYAFGACSNLIDVYYDGSRYCYKQIDIAPYNYVLEYANIHYSVIPTTAKNNAVLDDAAGLIYGLNAGIDSLEDYTNIELEGYYWEYTSARYGFGTGTTALLTNGETVMDGYTVVIFGDVNGDGWYDGEDAFLVNLIAKGMLSKDDVGEAIWTAADCNHDGAIDEADVDLLSGAGLKLNDVDQSKTATELAANSDYIEYVMLIDQSAGMYPDIAPDVDHSQQGTTDTNTTLEQPADEIDIEAILTNIFEFFKKLFTLVFSFVIK